MMISVTLTAQMRTNSSYVTLGSPGYSSSPPSVTAVFHVSSTMACCVCVCRCVCKQALYKTKAKDLLRSGCNELLRPDILTALYQSTMGSKVNSHSYLGNSDPCVHKQAENNTCGVLGLTGRDESHQVAFIFAAVSGQGLIPPHTHPTETFSLHSSHFLTSTHSSLFIHALILPSPCHFHSCLIDDQTFNSSAVQ